MIAKIKKQVKNGIAPLHLLSSKNLTEEKKGITKVRASLKYETSFLQIKPSHRFPL